MSETLRECPFCGKMTTYPCPMMEGGDLVVHIYEFDDGSKCPASGVYRIAAWNRRASDEGSGEWVSVEERLPAPYTWCPVDANEARDYCLFGPQGWEQRKGGGVLVGKITHWWSERLPALPAPPSDEASEGEG